MALTQTLHLCKLGEQSMQVFVSYVKLHLTPHTDTKVLVAET